MGVGTEQHFDTGRRRLRSSSRRLGRSRQILKLQLNLAWPQRGPLNETVVKSPSPALLELGPDVLVLPMIPDHAVIAQDGLLLHHRAEEFVDGFSITQRGDKRLNH